MTTRAGGRTRRPHTVIGLVGLLIAALGVTMVGVTTAAYKDQAHVQTTALEGTYTPEFRVGLSINSRMVDSAVAVGNDGNVYTWGRTGGGIAGGAVGNGASTGPLKVPSGGDSLPEGGMRQVTGGIYNVNGLDSTGQVWGWGTFASRDGTDAAKPSDNPRRVRIGTAWNGTGAVLDGMLAISSTEYAGAGIRSDGTIWYWGGETTYGGNGTALGASQLSGMPDPTVPGQRPVYIKGAYTNFFVMLENGAVYYWGGVGANSLPSGLAYSTTPVRITSLDPWTFANVPAGDPYIVAVDGGIGMGAAILSNGDVLSWGITLNRTGRPTTANPTTPGRVPGLAGIQNMQFGFTGVAMMNNTGDLWGYGTDDPDYGGFPITPALIDSSVTQYASGQGYYIWQRSDGTFWGRGYNTQTQIGQPASPKVTTNRLVSYDLSAVRK